MGSWLIMALNGALLVGSCFVVANLITQIGAATLEPVPTDTAAARIERPANDVAAAPSAILERNLFGAQLAGEAQALVPEDEPLAATKLPLKLLGTAAANDERRSRAAIQDEKTQKHLVVAVGDELEGHARVSVRAIERTRVVLDNAGRPEELVLREDDPSLAAVRKAPARRGARRTAARPAPDASLNQRLKTLNGPDGQGISQILSSARIVPQYSDGQMQGMRVDSIKADSLFQKVGLQNGDVITEVNGIVIDRVEATSAIFDEFATAEQIDIAALRGGSAVKLSASATDLLEQR
ncbi:MAG: type II secretion system protein N [Myxococcota bacterium]